MPISARPAILVIEDDPSIRGAITDFLAGNGFAAHAVSDGAEADRALARQRFDLITLDLMLPGEDGLSICRRLAGGDTPILIVSALGDSVDRIVGLELGASDYLPKPFEPRELLARIRALLRRVGRGEGGDQPRCLCFEGLRFDARDGMLSDRAGNVVQLTAGDLRLLDAFLGRPGRLLSRPALLDLVHGEDAGPFDRAIDLAVSRLRRKLADAGAPHCVETVRGMGYRFVARVDAA